MRPLGPGDLLANALRVLRINPAGKTSLQEALERPLWIDFVADTGDDRDVSQAVGRMVFEEYTVRERVGDADGDADRDVVLPRGDVLLFGGDTAYPVATADEIFRRVVSPWNEVLREEGVDDGRTRVLLGIPGNHDWYDGLDGFGRMFRRRPHADERSVDAGAVASRRSRRPRTMGVVVRQLHLDEVGGFLKLVADAWKSVSAFFRGTKLARRRRLALVGYEPIQESSFWALPLAKNLDLSTRASSFSPPIRPSRWGIATSRGRACCRPASSPSNATGSFICRATCTITSDARSALPCTSSPAAAGRFSMARASKGGRLARPRARIPTRPRAGASSPRCR
jgi:hypothetical protein